MKWSDMKTLRKVKKATVLIVCFAVLVLSLFHADVSCVNAQGTTILALAPSSYTAQVINDTFSINITIANVQDLWSWKVGITWEQSVLSLISGPSEGPFLKKSVGATLFLSGSKKNGSISWIADQPLYSDNGVSGSGTLATLTFRIKEDTLMSPVTLVNDTLLAPPVGGISSTISHQVQDATVSLGAAIRADAGGDQTVNESTPVMLNASGTLPKEANMTFTWIFVDRKKVELIGMIVNYTFTIPGVYAVNLTVSDPAGRTASDTITITVKDVTPPVAVITLDGTIQNQTVVVDQSVLFSGLDSYDPKNGTITSYTWNLGDGMEGYTPTVSHAYANPGTYNVSLTVNENGGNNNTATIIITVTKANYPLSPFSYDGEILIAITAFTLIALPFWISRAQHKRNERSNTSSS